MQLSLFKRSPYWVEVDVYITDPNDSQFYITAPLEVDFTFTPKTGKYQVQGYFLDGKPVELSEFKDSNDLENLNTSINNEIDHFITNYEEDYERDDTDLE